MPSGLSGLIAVDSMGGDLGPAEVVAAIHLAIEQLPALHPIILVGDEGVLRPLLAENGLMCDDRLSILHASEAVTMDDKPMVVLRRKKDSSMVRAVELVKNGSADVVVSCGNTGALMAVGTLRLRTIDGIARPALAAVVPREGGHFILIDAGANPDAKADNLVHNAILGSHYCRVVLGVSLPRVGLMTIGTEEGKGNGLVAEAGEMLKRLGTIVNYSGPIEGFQVFSNHVDVVVCDGFVGNIMLKSWESLVSFVRDVLREELKANAKRKAGAWLSRGAFNALKERINPERYGGAPLLGLKGNILKAHGSSNRRAILSAISAANNIIDANMNHRIEIDVARANKLLST